MLKLWKPPRNTRAINVFDPALGDGELLLAVLKNLQEMDVNLSVSGYETNQSEMLSAETSALRRKYLHITALRLIYLSSAFWRNYMAIREMGNNFRHDALVHCGVNIYT